jgi:hypothetical protein
VKFSLEQQNKDAVKLITTIMLVSNTRTDRARLRDRADVIVYGIKAGVTELDIRRFLEVDGRKVVSIYIHDGSVIVIYKERWMAVAFFCSWHSNQMTTILGDRRLKVIIINQHVRAAVFPECSTSKYDRQKLSVIVTPQAPIISCPEESSTATTASFLTSESSTATTVTALDETVLGLDSFDKDLQKQRVDILREHHVAYMHPRWKFSLEGDRKRFLSNASPRLKTKLLESRVRDRSRSRLRRLQDRRNQRKRVIRSAASMIQALNKEQHVPLISPRWVWM